MIVISWLEAKPMKKTFRPHDTDLVSDSYLKTCLRICRQLLPICVVFHTKLGA